MNNKRTWIFTILSVIFFGSLSIHLPLFDGNTDLLSLALSVNSVLFGLLTGFFITEMWDKYTSIRKESAELRGALLSMIKNVRRIQSNDQHKDLFEKRMEKFLIAFIIISWENLKEEEKYFEVVTDTIGDIKPVNQRDIPIYGEILDAEKVATESRSKLAALGKQGLVKIEWAILITLSSIITVSVFLLRDGSLFFYVLATVLPSMVLLMMMLLDDLDNLRWGTSMVSFKPAEDALEELRKKKFFERRYIENGWVQEPDIYRTEEDLEGELKEVYEDIKLKDCLRGKGILGPKL